MNKKPSGELTLPSEKKPTKSKEKDDQKKKKLRGTSFFKSLKTYLPGKSLEKEGDGRDQKSSDEVVGKFGDDVPDSPVKYGKASKSEKASKNDERTPQNQEEDPALYLINNFKAHALVKSLRKRKNTIIKAVAITISIILIAIGIIYALTPTERVASNVIFGEREMFSVFLFLVAFLILAAVFARRLLEGKYLKDIHHDLEIMEGKKQKDDHENSNHDPIMERMNKRDK